MIHTEIPNKGFMAANWDIASNSIKCWADAIGALVYHIGDMAVLASDEREALDAIRATKCNKELKRIQSEIRSLEHKIYDLEDEIEEYKKDEEEVLARMRAVETQFRKRDNSCPKSQLVFNL